MTAAEHTTAAPGGSTFASTEDLIRAGHSIVDEFGVAMGVQKVTRTVRRYREQVEGKGISFFDFFANAVQLDEQQRRQAALNPDVVRVIAYSDPTGEQAVRNVMAGR